MWSCLSLQCSKTGLVPYVWDIMLDIFSCSQVDRHMIRVWWFRGSVFHKGTPYWWCVALTTGFTWKQSWGSLFGWGLRYCVACKVQFLYIGNKIKIKVFCLYLYIGKKKKMKKSILFVFIHVTHCVHYSFVYEDFKNFSWLSTHFMYGNYVLLNN